MPSKLLLQLPLQRGHLEKNKEKGPTRPSLGSEPGRGQGPQRAQGKARCPSSPGIPSPSCSAPEQLGLSGLPGLSLGAPSPLTTKTGLVLAGLQGGPGPRPDPRGKPCPADVMGTMVTVSL